MNLKENFTASISLHFNGFTYYLTLFSEYFSSFPRGTCMISVSRPYLALGGMYLPIQTALSSSPTLWMRPISRRGNCALYGEAQYGAFTLYRSPFQVNLASKHRAFLGCIARLQFPATRQTPEGKRGSLSSRVVGFKAWAFPFSLAVTKGITVVFFSSAY